MGTIESHEPSRESVTPNYAYQFVFEASRHRDGETDAEGESFGRHTVRLVAASHEAAVAALTRLDLPRHLTRLHGRASDEYNHPIYVTCTLSSVSRISYSGVGTIDWSHAKACGISFKSLYDKRVPAAT